MISNLEKELQNKFDKKKAKLLQGFFKTGKGEYGEGDLFLGIVVPQLHKIASEYANLVLKDLQKTIKSKFHEERLATLFILVLKFEKANEAEKKNIYDFYIKNRKYVNNWDLVDLSAPKIAGAYLKNKDKSLLYKFAKSKNLWERRIAVLSTFHYIRNGDCWDATKIAKILKNDKHDLIQKAVGWMLREIGNRCGRKIEEKFLEENHKNMPRTMLRYATEKFPAKIRNYYLRK
ncbi:MAG: DNA alkylation repair protein [Patescibacteria group bacterium]